MDLAAIIDDAITRCGEFITLRRVRLRQIARPDRRLAVAAGDIQHIFRLAQAGDAPAQGPHQLLPMLERGAQMRGARREIAVVQVVRLDPVLDEAAHQGFQRRRIVIDAAQQHRLAHQGNAGIGQPRAGSARRIGEFAGMIGMHGDPGRRALDPCSAATISALTRAGSATGTRVWMRMILT